MKTRIKTLMVFFVSITMFIFLVIPAPVFAAEPTVNLGTTENFAVLAGTTVTNTGSTVISGSVGGNVGVSPGTAITGFPPGTIEDGTIHSADAVALQAQTDLVIAYDDAAGRTMTEDLTGKDLGGQTLTAGVYSFDTSAQLTGMLTLDAENDPEAVFIFQISSTLTTASSSSISLINGARFCRVFWQVGSSATLGTDSDFVGHIFALTSITANTDATVQGQLLARNGAVTLDSNTITNGVCAAPTPTEGATDETDTDETTAEETNADETTAEETTADETTTGETTTDNEEVPQTGESDNYLLFTITLLALAGILTYAVRRRQTR